MQTTTADPAIIHLTTDLDFNILDGLGQLNGLAPSSASLKGQSFSQLFPAVAPHELEALRKRCLLHPGGTQELRARHGVNGHTRLFRWIVCTRESMPGQPEGFTWVGAELPPPAAQPLGATQLALLDHIGESVMTFDNELRLTGANRKAESLFGFSAAAAVGTRMLDQFNWQSGTATKAEAIEQLLQEGYWEGTYCMEQQDATMLYLAGKMIRVQELGLTQGFIVIDRDVTAEHKLEQERQQNESGRKILEAIMDQSGALCWATNAAGDKVFFNQRMREVIGLPDDVRTVSIFDIFSPDIAAQYQAENLRVIEDGLKFTKLESGPEAKGSRNWYRTLKFPVQTAEGLFAAGFAYDVTHEQNQEQELTYLKKRFEIAASITADIISDWDVVNDRLWRNDPDNEILVHKEKARTMQMRFDRLYAGDRKRFIQALNDALLSASGRWECEYRYATGNADDTYKLLHERAIIIRDEAGEAVRMISVIRDVTEERKLEQELKEKEKAVVRATMEGQEAERNELARELHDNVGQVLAMCKLFVDITADSVQHDYLDKCRVHLNQAIREIRSLSHRLSPVLLDRKGLPGALSEMVDNINETCKLHLSLDLSGPFRAAVLSNESRTAAYRIVQEAVNNIIKHAGATKAVIRLWTAGHKLCLSVTDDGVGFDTDSSAAGIGLKNMFSRVELLNGTMRIDSAPGKGCCLSAELPLN